MKLLHIKKVAMIPMLILALLCSGITGCKKLVDVNPPTTAITSGSAYNSDATAIAILTGIYSSMSKGGLTGGEVCSLTLFAGLSSDEFSLFSGVTDAQRIAYYRNSLASNKYGYEYWNILYPYIFKCNDAIAGLNASKGLTPAVKQHLLGEAKFMRAFFYFYMVNLYGDVPLAISNDYQLNSSLPRSSQAQVYQQIITDLTEAQNLLGSNYLDGTLLKAGRERIRPASWTATALLSRVYLYTKNYVEAEKQAGALINNSSLFSLSSLDNAFLKYSSGNSEAIWQLQPVNLNSNTEDAKAFIVTSTGPNTVFNKGALINNYLLNSFEAGDNRKTKWIGNIEVSGTTYYFPYKYKIGVNQPVNEYLDMCRLGEQYLIRAEARAQLGEANAVDDMNAIRNRAGLSNYSGATDKTSLLVAILHERQVELFAEFGHRWFDLKRTNNIDAVMGTGGVCGAKGGTWTSNWQWYPLPLTDLQLDANLTQNSGY